MINETSTEASCEHDFKYLGIAVVSAFCFSCLFFAPIQYICYKIVTEGWGLLFN